MEYPEEPQTKPRAAYTLFLAAGLQFMCGFPMAAFGTGDAVRLPGDFRIMAALEAVLSALLFAVLGVWALWQPVAPAIVALATFVVWLALQMLMLPELTAQGLCLTRLVVGVVLVEALRIAD